MTCFLFRMTEQSSTDDLCILLEFAIARGNLGSIMNVLKILFRKFRVTGYASTDFEVQFFPSYVMHSKYINIHLISKNLT